MHTKKKKYNYFKRTFDINNVFKKVSSIAYSTILNSQLSDNNNLSKHKIDVKEGVLKFEGSKKKLMWCLSTVLIW